MMPSGPEAVRQIAAPHSNHAAPPKKTNAGHKARRMKKQPIRQRNAPVRDMADVTPKQPSEWPTRRSPHRFGARPDGMADDNSQAFAARLAPGRPDQAENEDPQPQVVVALGFLMTNCEPCRSSL